MIPLTNTPTYIIKIIDKNTKNHLGYYDQCTGSITSDIKYPNTLCLDFSCELLADSHYKKLYTYQKKLSSI